MGKKKIKVAYIATPVTFGGAERVSLNFLSLVDRNSFDISPILFTRPWEEAPDFARQVNRLGYNYETVPVALKKEGERLRVPRVAFQLYSVLKKKGSDVVHTHGYFADLCGLPVARLLGIRCVSTCHGFISNDRKLKVYNRLDKYALRLSNTVIAVSGGIRAELVQSGIKASRIAVIPNALSLNLSKEDLFVRRKSQRLSLGIDLNDFVVGYLGRLSKEKGLNALIEAFTVLCKTSNTLRLLIVGDGPERQVLEQMVTDQGITNRVVFAGFQKDIENWLPALDVFVLPSLTEGTPMALLEAMAMRVPVIATSVGGIPQVVNDGVNGLLLPTGNPVMIREKIEMLRDRPAFSCQLGEAGANTIRVNYNAKSWARAIEKCYWR